MTRTLLTAALAAAALAAPAMADDRPARSLGVEPGAHGLSEPAQPKTAMEKDHRRVGLITGRADGVLSTGSPADGLGLGISAPEGAGSGKAQPAGGPSRDPDGHTLAEPARMHVDAHD